MLRRLLNVVSDVLQIVIIYLLLGLVCSVTYIAIIVLIYILYFVIDRMYGGLILSSNSPLKLVYVPIRKTSVFLRNIASHTVVHIITLCVLYFGGFQCLL